MPSIQQKQQEIRSLLQNFDWETNPSWLSKLNVIQDEIEFYWLEYKN